ncbi:MAG TPA: PIG-L deacetylase family protein [Actinomycetes bacterium]|jgi:LmbE family N-acetylglucosaminyl deacetylase|nr:PIG-L deacetylase family protein [Actinomycetes bacterium]
MTAKDESRVVAIGAHPDDVDFRVGGSLARWAAAGAEVIVIVVSDGDRGSWTPVAPNALAIERLREQAEGARTLGAARLISLHRSDGAIYDTAGLSQELCLWYRLLRPTTVVTHDPWRRYNLHPDHRAVGWAACNAVVAARNANFHPEQLDHLQLWSPRQVLLFLPLLVNHVVDVSDHIERKIDAVLCHRSQLAGWASRADPDAADQAEAVRGRILQLAADTAVGQPFRYGEAFHRLTSRRTS